MPRLRSPRPAPFRATSDDVRHRRCPRSDTSGTAELARGPRLMLPVLAHRGPDDEGSRPSTVSLRHAATVDPGPDTGRQPADGVGERTLLDRLQRRDLQLPGARAGAGGRRRGLHQRHRHGGHPGRLRGVGPAVRRALQRHLGVRAVGRRARAAAAVPRPLRRQAAVPGRARRPAGVRQRDQGGSWPSRGCRADPDLSRSATSCSTRWSTTRTAPSSAPSAACRRRTTSSRAATGGATSSATGARHGTQRRRGPAPTDRGRRAASTRFAALLIDAVALQLRSDVPVGSCLSGGLDSSSIVSIAAGLRRQLRWTQRRIRTRGAAAAGVLRRVPRAGHRRAALRRRGRRAQRASSCRPRRRPPRLLRAPSTRHRPHQDEPFPSTSIVAQYHVMRIAHESGRQGAAGRPKAPTRPSPAIRIYVPMAVACSIRGGVRGRDGRARGPCARSARLSQCIRPSGHRRAAAPTASGALRIPVAWLGPETSRRIPLSRRAQGRPRDRPRRGLWRQMLVRAPAGAAALRGPQQHGLQHRGPGAVPRPPAWWRQRCSCPTD